jgi:hypothetical protein
MSKKSKQELLSEARTLAVDAVKLSDEQQARFWKFMEIDVHAADREMNGRQFQLIWAKLEELANKDAYPLWMDAIIIGLSALLPVNAIVGAIGSRIARSLKLIKLPDFKYAAKAGTKQAEQMYLKNAKQLSAIMRSEPSAARFLTRDSADLKAWLDAGTILQPELTVGLRNIIRLGATAATRPLFSGSALKDPKQAASTVGASLPAVAVFKSLLQWVEVSRSSDKKILELLMEEVKTSQDEQWLRTVPGYLDAEAKSTSANFNDVPPEWFQRFVEACLWCTTFDFTPQFKPGSPARTMRYRGELYDVPATNPRAVLLPLPDAFWANLIARHYDPFIGNGSKTYQEAGRSSYVAPEGAYAPLGRLEGELVETGMEFDPRTRLSMHWSGILAPAILGANQSVTATLSRYLGL